MLPNESTDGKSTVPRQKEQIARAVCLDCDHERTHTHPTDVAADDAALEDAMTHRREEDHAVRAERIRGRTIQLGTPASDPQVSCGRCDEPIHGTIGTGPSITDETNQPCGCTPTAGVNGE